MHCLLAFSLDVVRLDTIDLYFGENAADRDGESKKGGENENEAAKRARMCS